MNSGLLILTQQFEDPLSLSESSLAARGAVEEWPTERGRNHLNTSNALCYGGISSREQAFVGFVGETALVGTALPAIIPISTLNLTARIAAVSGCA